jgi:formamidopyrimidine-DNA glycosylase
MPELSEVETMRRGMQPVVGGRIVAGDACRCKCRPIAIAPKAPSLAKRIIGRRIDSTHRLGKRVLLRFDSGEVLIFEPRMTGLALLTDPPDTDDLRFRLELKVAKAREVWYWDRRGLGSVR